MRLDAVMRLAVEAAEHGGSGLIGLPSGFADLDAKTGGFQPAELTILAARPGLGKTALGLQFALAAARRPASPPVLVFSLEMSRLQVGLRLLCGEARVDWQRVRRGLLSDGEFSELMQMACRLHDLPLYIDDTSVASVLDVRARTRRLQGEHGLAMIVIDYLQLLTASRRRDNRQQEVSDISRELKLLAKELQVPVIALSQLSCAVENRKPAIPVLSDLYDSGSIEQDADLILFIYRPDVYEPNAADQAARLIIAKQRNGPLGEVRLAFTRQLARFDALAHSYPQALAG
jgi:replicative DNA helicase